MMKPYVRGLALIGLLLSGLASPSRAITLEANPQAEGTIWSFRLNPVLELHHWVIASGRKLQGQEISKAERKALRSYRGIEESYAASQALTQIDGFEVQDFINVLGTAVSVKELILACQDPDTQLPEKALTYAKSLERLEAKFNRKNWRGSQKGLEKIREDLTRLESEKVGRSVAFLGRGFGLKDPGGEIDFVLVTDADFLASRRRSGDRTTIGLGVGDLDADTVLQKALAEAALHLDQKTHGEKTIPFELRELMIQGDISPKDPLYEEVQMALYAIHGSMGAAHVFGISRSGRVKSPKRTKGMQIADLVGAEERWPRGFQIVHDPWRQFVEGTKTRKELMIAIVSHAMKLADS